MITSTDMFSFSHRTTLAVNARQELRRLADALARLLKPGDVVLLDGPLGAGKTTLVQELGASFGLREPVASPTFVLMHEYESGPFPVTHVDLYRLGAENATALADELLSIIDEGRSLVLVEWAVYGKAFLSPVATFAIELAFPPEASPESEARLVAIASRHPLPESLIREFGTT